MNKEDIENQPLVAIAVPVYNTEKYFRDCLDHILAQTYKNWICYITDNAVQTAPIKLQKNMRQKMLVSRRLEMKKRLPLSKTGI